MDIHSLPNKYSFLQAWLHDNVIADRALGLHAYILEYGKLVNVLAEHKERFLLDVGCGGGQSAIRLKEHYPHLCLTGIDLSTYLIARARQRAQRKGYEIHFEVADAEALPFPDASFDIVYFYAIARFPRLLQKPVSALLYKRMFCPSLSVETYRQMAAKLQMPPATVSHLPSMPAFLFRTQKPIPSRI